MAQHGVEGWNTKIWRREEEMERNGLPLYELWIASSEKLPTEVYTYRVYNLFFSPPVISRKSIFYGKVRLWKSGMIMITMLSDA